MVRPVVYESRRLEFICGRLCAQRALQDIGIHDAEVQVAHDGSPIWPTGVVGSISHTDTFAAAAVVSSTELRSIGVDSEKIVERQSVDTIRQECLTTREDAQLQSYLGAYDICVLCTLFFSAKESVWKALYPVTQEFLEFRDVEIAAFDFSTGNFRESNSPVASESLDAGHLGVGRFRVSGSFVHTSFEMEAEP